VRTLRNFADGLTPRRGRTAFRKTTSSHSATRPISGCPSPRPSSSGSTRWPTSEGTAFE
jgi:hypothetical protein